MTGERIIEQRGLFFEEFEPGARYRHSPGRTATEADNVLFTTLTMNTQALHLDETVAAESPFGKRLINSMWTLSVMVGSSVAQLTQGTLVAQVALSDIAFPAPLYAGDTLRTESVVIDKRVSASRPGQGIVVIEHTGTNQHGTIVATARRTVLVRMAGTE